MIDGIHRIQLRLHADDRGSFVELRNDSGLPKPVVQSNLSFSRAGVVRGLDLHEKYDLSDPDEHTVVWNDPRVAHPCKTSAQLLSARDSAVSS